MEVAAQSADVTGTVIEHAFDSNEDGSSPMDSPEWMADNEVFEEEDFEASAMGPDIGDPFCEVGETLHVEKEEAAPRKVFRDFGGPTQEAWNDHCIAHILGFRHAADPK